VAESLGIEEYHYELMPQDKADLIEQMKAQGRITLMIGDGVNDAPAFAKSGVSLAMAKIGSEIAVETSDISLFNDDLSRLPQLMRLAKRGIFAIKFNIALALAINAITVALSAAGFLNAVWGALLHNLSSVLVALSSALLLTQKSRGKNTLK
jgi:P-type E1-E2 ATPase